MKFKILFLIITFALFANIVSADNCNCDQYQGDEYNNCIAQCSQNSDYTNYQKVQCGDVLIPTIIPQITSLIIVIIQIVVPVIIVLFGMFDLIKSLMAQKEDEIKTGRQTFIKRMIIGFSVFFVFVLVKFIIGIIPLENNNALTCIDCFVNNQCSVTNNVKH